MDSGKAAFIIPYTGLVAANLSRRRRLFDENNGHWLLFLLIPIFIEFLCSFFFGYDIIPV
jgi:hypothetical protein